MENSEKPILLFDGVCNLCNSSVQFILLRDKASRICFAALQSESGQAVLKKYNLPTNDFDSFVFVENGQAYVRSTAALKVAKHLSGIYRLGSLFLVVPTPLRDLLYKFVARNRYRWFGKQESCMVPTPELKSRFLP